MWLIKMVTCTLAAIKKKTGKIPTRNTVKGCLAKESDSQCPYTLVSPPKVKLPPLTGADFLLLDDEARDKLIDEMRKDFMITCEKAFIETSPSNNATLRDVLRA